METTDNDPQREYFPFLYSFKDAINEIPQKYRLEIYEAITDYAFFKKEPELKTNFSRFAWKIIFPILKKSWQKVENGRKGGGQLNNSNALKRAKNEQKTSKTEADNEASLFCSTPKDNIDKDKEIDKKNNDIDMQGGLTPSRKRETKRFTKPSLQEIKDFILENSYNVVAEVFYDYYQSNGWIVGKTPMKDWKATIRRWHRTQNPKSEGVRSSTPDLAGTGDGDASKESETDYSERF